MNVRVSMVSGAAEHDMLEGMFPRVTLECKTSLKRFVAANGELIRDLRVNTLFHARQTRELKDAQHSEVRVLSRLTFSMQKVVRSGNIVVLDEKNPHI